MSFDIHAHIIVPEILREASSSEEWRPVVSWENDKQFVSLGPKRIGSATREFVSLDKIIAEMQRSGVDGCLLSPWVSLVRYEVDASESLAGCQVQNDALASLVKKFPVQIHALGLVPLQNVQLSILELERAMKIGLKGVEIGAHVNGIYPGDASFLPFWEACEALGAVVFIHPVEGGGRPELKDHYMWNVIGNPMDTTIAAGHMILTGVMEAYPRLKIILAHGGGTLPYIHGRLDRGYKMRPEINKTISQPPTSYLKKFYFDSITHDADCLRSLVELVGPEQVLLGSDYPFDMGLEDPAGLVKAAGFTADIEDMILQQNAIKLLGS